MWYQQVTLKVDANDQNGTKIVITYAIICMNNACNSNSKDSPFTKVMDLLQSHSSWTHLLEKQHLGHQKVINNLEFDWGYILSQQKKGYIL